MITTPIVHWHTHWEKNQSIFQNYAQQMDNFYRKIDGNYLSKLFKNRVKVIYGGEKEAQMVLGLLNKIKNSSNSEFKKEIDTVYKTVTNTFRPYSSFNLTQQDFTDYANKISLKTKEIDEYFKNVDKCFNDIYTYYGTNFKTMEGFFRYYAGKMKSTEFLKEVKKFYVDSNNVITIDSKRIQSLAKGAQGSLKSLSRLKQNGYNPSNFKTAEDFSNAIRNFLNNQMGTLTGYMYEGFLANSKLYLDKQILKILGPNATMMGSGAEGAADKLEYSTITTDIKIKPGSGQAKISVPIGISVKKATPSKNNNLSFKVKSSNLGKMLDILNARTGLMTDSEYEALLNLTANFRKAAISKVDKKTIRKTASAEDAHKTAFEYKNMNALVHQLNKALMVTGLGGSLSSQDISTILIVNNNAFNIVDILREVGKRNNFENAMVSNGLTFSKIADMVSQHKFLAGELSKELQRERSQAINSVFREINMDLKLHLSQSLMKKLNKI